MTKNLNVSKPIENIDAQTLKKTFEYSRSPVILTDCSLPDNPIIYCNEAFLEMCGYSMREIIGKNCRFLQGEDTDPAIVTTLREAVSSGKSARVVIKNYTKKGRYFWNDLILSPIADSDGTITHFMGMQMDVTSRIDAEERLVHKTEELQDSIQELEQFTYATSHDLQEPLRMINSYLQLINKRYGQDLDEDGKEFLGFATEGADRMQALVNDLLLLSRVSNDQERFRSIDMNAVVSRTVENLKLSIDDADAKIEVDELPTITADPTQMMQLLQNLISNALKYASKQRKPVIRISVVKDKRSYVFSVKDNGIGIARKHFDRIFVVFQRLHTRNEYPGTGIGLAICSKIIDRHEGSIWVESDEGKGSEFKFSIPIHRGES